MTKVWEWSRSEGACLLVALSLADHADDDGFCYPGVERLAKKCRVSVRSIQRHIKELESLGEIQVDIGKGITVQGGATNRYRITVTQSGASLSPGDKRPSEVVTETSRSGDKAVSPKSSGEPSEEPSGGQKRVTSIKSKMVFPDAIDTTFFERAWAKWYAYRRSAKLKAYTPQGAKAQLTILAEIGPERAIAAIEHSIAQGYQGIYEPKNTAQTSASNGRSRNAGTHNEGKAGNYADFERLAPVGPVE